jgi:hypothetical protein
MRAECVADELGLSRISIYTGAGGTGCLYAGRIKRGSRVYFLRARVHEHKRLEVELGQCNGRCVKAKPKPRQRQKSNDTPSALGDWRLKSCSA